MSQLYVAVLAIIVVVLLAVAIFRATRVKTKADYLVAGRSLPALVLVLTLLTSWIGAGSLFAGAENAFKNGFAALWQPAGGWSALHSQPPPQYIELIGIYRLSPQGIVQSPAMGLVRALEFLVPTMLL